MTVSLSRCRNTSALQTGRRPGACHPVGAVVAAALALPGVWLPSAQAQTASERPTQAVLWLKYLNYEESQPGLKRISVKSPSVRLVAPLGAKWAVEGGLVADSLSGATPRWQTAVSSASGMSDERKAGDVKFTRYFDRSSYAVGVSHSTENDYVSTALTLGASWSSPDKNTTWNLSVAGTSDKIRPTGGGVAGVLEDKRDSTELLVGVTQALSGVDLVQLNLTLSDGEGYYNDPYKWLDERPRGRKQAALLARWNHHLAGLGTTVRSSYRYYRDSFGIDAHTVQAEWFQPVGGGLSVTPLLRYYSQSAAHFYAAAQVDGAGLPVLPVLAPGSFNSGDQRLAAFGAVTLGVKAEYALSPSLSIDGKLERYEQRTGWRLGGGGSQGLAPLRANIVQVGVRYSF